MLLTTFCDLIHCTFNIPTFHASASPVARNLARNPFQRHPSYDLAVNTYLRPSSASPSPVSVTLSPAAVPLPLPTPDEIDPDRIS